jgi:dTDP-4-dehydrorhamnose 3,5-epimerase
MDKYPTRIHGAWRLKPRVFTDARGFFLESWSREVFRQAGIDVDFVQDNHSRSSRHVLRGLHYQSGGAAQGKLVWVTSGTVFDVMVDLRLSSPTFGMWDGCLLTTEEHERVYVPPGCAHGFLVMSESADFHYKVTVPYDPAAERVLRWNDEVLAIDWPLDRGVEPFLSQKDRNARCFGECEKYP